MITTLLLIVGFAAVFASSQIDSGPSYSLSYKVKALIETAAVIAFVLAFALPSTP